MEDTDLLQSNGDDEVMVRQADGAFKKMKMSELSTVPVALKQILPLVQAPPPSASPVSQPVARSSAKVQPASVAPIVKSAPPVASPPPVPMVSATVDFDRQASALVGRLATDVPEDLKPRVKMLLVSYMKGIRQEYAVRERLLQSVESGGLGWSADKADLFLKQMKVLGGSTGKDMANTVPTPEVKKETKTPLAKQTVVSVKTPVAAQKSIVPVVAPNLLPEVEPEMHMSKASEAPPQPKPQSERPPLPKSEQKKQESAQQPQLAPRTSDGIRASAPPVLKIVEEKGEKPKMVPRTDAIVPQKQPPQVAIPQTPSGKADVKDIAYKPRLVGPIDELRTLTLVDFRRLSRDSQVAVDKIHSKVELLGEESFEKKTKGILAWRASEINQLYNGLLNESIKTGVPIREILATRASHKETSLTMEEFQAIMNLNRQLRF